jgi:hypothetical protein
MMHIKPNIILCTIVIYTSILRDLRELAAIIKRDPLLQRKCSIICNHPYIKE